MLTDFWDMKGSIAIDFIEKKKSNFKQCFLLLTSEAKSTFFIEGSHIYISVYLQGSSYMNWALGSREPDVCKQ